MIFLWIRTYPCLHAGAYPHQFLQYRYYYDVFMSGDLNGLCLYIGEIFELSQLLLCYQVIVRLKKIALLEINFLFARQKILKIMD